MIAAPLRVIGVRLLLPLALAVSPLLLPGGGASTAPPPDGKNGGDGRRRDDRGLGKISDGPPTEINCSLSTSGDYSYYAERCHDGATQWWINGRCVDGVKEESSELYRCARSDGSRAHCHDCLDPRSGYSRHVCGADSPDRDEVCGIAQSGHATDCGEVRIKSYSYQCGAVPSLYESEDDDEFTPASRSSMWYMCESFRCAESEASRRGPRRAACGREWHYAFEEDDHPSGEEHPFASPDHAYCLDCGRGIQVCAKAETATCESLGLPVRGVAYVSPGSSALDDSNATSAENSDAAGEEDQDSEAPHASPGSSAPNDSNATSVENTVATGEEDQDLEAPYASPGSSALDDSNATSVKNSNATGEEDQDSEAPYAGPGSSALDDSNATSAINSDATGEEDQDSEAPHASPCSSALDDSNTTSANNSNATGEEDQDSEAPYASPGSSALDDFNTTSAKNSDATGEEEQDSEAPKSTIPSENDNVAQNKALNVYPERHRLAWIAHGMMGSIVFVLLVPLAITCPSLVPKHYYWTYVVGCVNLLIFAATLCAVGTAVWTMEGMGNAGEGHMKENHHIVGLLLLLLTSFQMANGLPAVWLIVFGLGAFQVHSGLGLFAERFQRTDWGDAYVGYVASLSTFMILIKCTHWRRGGADRYGDEEEIQMSHGGSAFGESSYAKNDLMLEEFESQENSLV